MIFGNKNVNAEKCRVRNLGQTKRCLQACQFLLANCILEMKHLKRHRHTDGRHPLHTSFITLANNHLGEEVFFASKEMTEIRGAGSALSWRVKSTFDLRG